MKRMSPEARVGLLVLSGLLILVYMTFKVGKFGFGPDGGYVLYLRVDNAAGIAKNSEVLVAGIAVGVIRDVRLDSHEALLVLRIQSEVKLPRDSVASIRTHGLLGEKYVSVLPGSSSVFLKDGDYIRTDPGAADFEKLVATVNSVFEDLKRVSTSLAKALGTSEGERDVQDIVAGLRDTVQGLRDVVASNRDNLREAVANIRRFSEALAVQGSSAVGNFDRLVGDVGGVIDENREDLRESLVNLREGTAKLSKALEEAGGLFADARNPNGTLGRLMQDGALYEELSGAVSGLKTVLSRLEKGEGTLGKLIKDDALYAELRGSMENLRGITDKINQGQGTLGKLVNDTSVHQNLNTTLTGISDYVASGNRLQFEPGFWAEYLLGSGETRSYFNFDIRTRQDRFYRVALVSDPEGRVSTETVKVVDERTGKTLSERKKRTTEDEFKISAQVAKRFSFLTLRGGLIESTGGVAADVDLWNDRLRFTLEAFDFGNTQGGPHLKAAARLNFWNHFFVTGGVDELVGPGGRSNAFLGGGIHFLDEDLKYVFSSIGGLLK